MLKMPKLVNRLSAKWDSLKQLFGSSEDLKVEDRNEEKTAEVLHSTSKDVLDITYCGIFSNQLCWFRDEGQKPIEYTGDGGVMRTQCGIPYSGSPAYGIATNQLFWFRDNQPIEYTGDGIVMRTQCGIRYSGSPAYGIATNQLFWFRDNQPIEYTGDGIVMRTQCGIRYSGSPAYGIATNQLFWFRDNPNE